ncbi:MFS transporter [Actinotalea sp. M2MS4P-6]|uniref:MFS transporter n=1 Tax=Actinotalea sp. M2MS4P-6 TaxID=2983762 RepID=UPI0021E4D850|nr:MFS transporter [Actinotalea sp. M2MS4P-6]MCV2395995.1 MFS transporter [Actinotalea sp. M2MS4P-6]
MRSADLRSAADRYLAVLRRPSLALALVASLVGRMHESMIAFGVILVVTTDGSYADAGWVLAAYGAGGIVAAPLAARLADRFGHSAVLSLTAAGHAGAVLALAGGVGPVVPVAVVAGLLTPPLTPAFRSTLPRLAGEELRLTAFALESTVQEVVFIAGPVVAAAAAWLAGPRAALVVAAGATVVGVAGYLVAVARVAPREADGECTPDGGSGRRELLATPEVLRLMVGAAGFLLVLSVAAVAIVAAASGPSASAGAGILLGLSSLGSVLGGLWFGARPRVSALPRRFVALACGVAAIGLAAAAGGVVLLAVSALVYGTTIAPVGTVLFGRLSQVAEGSRATEAFGWMGAAMGVGGVLGDAGGGWLVTASPVLALAVAAGVALVTGALVRERRPSAV